MEDYVIRARKAVAVRIRELRKKHGWSQTDLAERAGIGMRHIQRIETSKIPPPIKLDTLIRLAHALQIKVNVFLKDF